MAGLWLVRIQGRRAWGALRGAVASGVIPDRELGDAALIVAGGALIAVPGFLTDVLGVLAVAPLTRSVMRRIFGFIFFRRAAGGWRPDGQPGDAGAGFSGADRGSGRNAARPRHEDHPWRGHRRWRRRGERGHRPSSAIARPGLMKTVLRWLVGDWSGGSSGARPTCDLVGRNARRS